MAQPTATISEQTDNVMGNDPSDNLRNASLNAEQAKKKVMEKGE